MKLDPREKSVVMPWATFLNHEEPDSQTPASALFKGVFMVGVFCQLRFRLKPKLEIHKLPHFDLFVLMLGSGVNDPSPLRGCFYLMRGPSSVSAIVSDVVPAIAPLVSAVVVLLVAATTAATAATTAPTTHVLLVGRLLRLHGPVPPVAPASKLLLPADTRAEHTQEDFRAAGGENLRREAADTGSLLSQQ